MRITSVLAAACALLFLLPSAPAQAQATRTWVSGVGDDANPCARTAPCKTFAGAISKTAAAGEISVLDPGGYGALTITKSISIIADGSEGSVLACGSSGIIINSATAVVNLRGLMFEGCGTGLSGIRIVQAASVNIEKCLIRGFRANSTATNGGIDITTSTAGTKVVVSDCTIAENIRGIVADPTGAGTVSITLNRVVVSKNSGAGVRGVGSEATYWLNQSVITGNATGLSSGVFRSFGNNVIADNGTNGSPTGAVIPLQ